MGFRGCAMKNNNIARNKDTIVKKKRDIRQSLFPDNMTACVKMQNTDYVYTCVIMEKEFLGWVKEMRHLNQEEKLKTDFFCRQHDCLCKKT